jgi:hypothetical protein
VVKPLEHSILFTGSVPGNSVEDVFRTLAGSVGSRALALPDGEIDPRRAFIAGLNRIWEQSDDLEAIESGFPEGGPERNLFTVSYRVKEGVSRVRLDGLLPYAESAIESYQVFTRLRDEGVIARGVRYQIALPSAYCALLFWFPRVQDWPALVDAWTRALQAEYRRMLEVIPGEDLAVQVDYASEIGFMTGAHARDIPWVTDDMVGDAGFSAVTSREYLAPHFAGLPDDVLTGYHYCLGTYPAFPRQPITDMSLVVDSTNALAANSGHRIDFYHLPVMPNADDGYFTPLARLDVGDSAVYLGVECDDGLEAMQRRIAHAEKHLARFGVAHYCGYVWKPDILPQLLVDLRDGADAHSA